MKGCITSLSRRASELFSCVSRGEGSDQGEEIDLETGKKLQTLLLHLILIVDVQVCFSNNVLLLSSSHHWCFIYILSSCTFKLSTIMQVLPHLLQEVAKLILGQTNPHRLYALEEAFDILAGSDDLTRKHILVPWLQSLSYLCSNFDEQRRSPSTRSSRRRKRRSSNGYDSEIGHGEGAVAFNPSSATILVESEADDTSQVSRSRL